MPQMNKAASNKDNFPEAIARDVRRATNKKEKEEEKKEKKDTAVKQPSRRLHQRNLFSFSIFLMVKLWGWKKSK